MAVLWSSSQPGSEQMIQQEAISEVEAFMASRVYELQEYGWNNERIAEALGVGEEFVEDHSSGHDEYYI